MPPPRRRPYRRRTYRRRRRAPSRMAIYSAAGSQLWRDVQKLKNFVNVEFKYIDNATNGIATSTLTSFLLNGVPEGDDQSSREGDSIRFKSIQLNANLSYVNATSNVRMIIFIDTQPRAGAPVMADVITGTGVGATTGLRNLDNRSRFVILKDKTWMVNNTTLSTHPIKWYRKLDMKSYYTTAAATSTSIQSHALWMFLVSDIPIASAANAPVFDGICRLRYIDN